MNESIKFPQDIQSEIDDQIAREKWKTKPVKPLESPVMALPHTSIYKMHRYYARRPHNVFSKIIEHYTNPGDLILDPFCGGGVAVVEALKLRRRVIGVDLNPLATWVTQVEVEPVDLEELEDAFNKWLGEVEKTINPLFEALCPSCGKMGIAEWFEWSNVVKCPECGKSAVLGRCKKLRGGVYQCSNAKCQAPVIADECKRLPDEMLNVLVNCPHCGEREIRDAQDSDKAKYDRIEKDYARIIKREGLIIPDDPFPDMNSVRENNLFSKGFCYFKDYFTFRQLIALARAKKVLKNVAYGNSVINTLYHTFSSVIRFTNKMVFRAKGWQSGNPIEWAGHIYWPPYVYNELNPVPVLKKRYKSIKSGKKEQKEDIGGFCRFPQNYRHWEEIKRGNATCWLLTQSSHDLPIPDKSIDTIITDPPFGGNVQYAELSDFYLVWVKEFLGLENGADKELEAIETRHQGFDGAKDRAFYEKMLFNIFKECRRVIKPEGWLVLTFHNRDIGVWMAMNRAAIRAGFRLPPQEESINRGMVYQPPIQNYTQTIHQKRTGSMLGDFILSFRPAEEPIPLDSVLQQLPTAQEKGLYEKAEEIIRFHGGADETTLMTGLLPYLQEQGLLARLARFDLRSLLSGGQFLFEKKSKKWYTSDMVDDSGHLKLSDVIPAEHLIQQIVHDYLIEKNHANFDDLLSKVYTILVNAHRPQLETIDRVLAKYCRKIKIKGKKREHYQWKTGVPSPLKIQQIKDQQIKLSGDQAISLSHNGIILRIAQQARLMGLYAHIGATERKRNGSLNEISLDISHFELGVPERAFKIIRQIDLIILKELAILSAIEVVTSIETLSKAINDRFRNLLSVIPNLNFDLYVVVKDEDFQTALREINSPANQKDGLANRIQLVKIGDIASMSSSTDWPFSK